jgi:hypothetical protein
MIDALIQCMKTCHYMLYRGMQIASPFNKNCDLTTLLMVSLLHLQRHHFTH